MERYWCLRWLAQEGLRQVDAVVLKDEVLRLLDIPLIIRLPGMPQIARGAQVRLEILRWDELDLSIEARLLEMLTTVTDEDLDDVAEEDLEDAGAAIDVGATETETEVGLEAEETNPSDVDHELQVSISVATVEDEANTSSN